MNILLLNDYQQLFYLTQSVHVLVFYTFNEKKINKEKSIKYT